MSDGKEVVVNGGMSGSTVIFIVLLLLKLGVGNTAVVNWSWWWIFAPYWIPFCILGAVLLVLLVVAIITEMCK